MHMVLAVVCLMREGEKDIGQFTPVHWDKDEWHPLQAAWHVIQPELKPCNLIMSLMNLQGTTTAAGLVNISESSYYDCFRTKEDPQLYYAPTKPLEEGTSEAEQRKEKLKWKYVSYETRSEYQKEIEEPYMGNVEKERKVANNSKPNSGNKGMKIVMFSVFTVTFSHLRSCGGVETAWKFVGVIYKDSDPFLGLK
ncbi:hypothetical protein Bca101_002685 [Brassica carinata]